ncbi:accessory Sec system translocase SecA2 [Fructilactobacillus sp. Tb1]|uniref:accessory Sec system translocase SecA2 n=1 Tax=Fructilactobacillus sp. Tb1 TaxID=3422304 RepID=UPI003D2A4556
MFDNKKQKYQKIANKVQKLSTTYQNMTDEELQKQTPILMKKVNGKRRNLKKVLPEAYAVVCEAAYRVLGMRPFPVQILGAVAMEYGNIAEMKTGEGKTLTATMPMYLHGLLNKPGNFLITANEYLAARDAADMGVLYRWLGLTVSSAVPKPGQDAKDRDLDRIYGANVVYTTNSTLGFDYLFDNLAKTPEEQHIKAMNFALLDEADAVLLDTAQTPLVIAGAPRVQSNYYQSSDQIVKLLQKDVDYKISDDLKNIWFTNRGIVQMEQYLDVDNLLSNEWEYLFRHLALALRANYLLKKDRNYVVKDGEVVLIDQENGRELKGMKMQAGLHQAVEAKENVETSVEQRAMATITYQDLFRMFNQLAGMTGTAATDAVELLDVYNLSVFKVPTNKPNIRIDKPDELYITNKAKLLDTLELVKKTHVTGRPILIETGSLDLSVLYSHLLLKAGIAHSLLNARSGIKEAEIIKNAGELGAVTVATSMAGRGTDIRIDDEAVALGGLLVLGTERMQNKRVDNQLRGRAGRQGDPGESVFYVSLEDKIMIENGSKSDRKYASKHAKDAKQKLKTKGRFGNAINKAQKVAVNQQRDARFETLQFGEIVRLQRNSIYEQRDEIMAAKNLDEIINTCFAIVAEQYVVQCKHHENQETMLEFIYQNINPDFNDETDLEAMKPKRQKQFLIRIMREQFKRAEKQLFDRDQRLYFEKLCILRAIDQSWIDQVDQLEVLKKVTKTRSIAQLNPVFEFQKEALETYQTMKDQIAFGVVRNLTNSDIIAKSDGTL